MDRPDIATQRRSRLERRQAATAQAEVAWQAAQTFRFVLETSIGLWAVIILFARHLI